MSLRRSRDRLPAGLLATGRRGGSATVSGCPGEPVSGSPWSVAAPPGSSVRWPPPGARPPGSARPTPSRPRRCRPGALRPGGRADPFGHHDRGGRPAARPAAVGCRPPSCSATWTRRHRSWPTGSSTCPSPTSSRWSRPGSPPARCCCSGPPGAATWTGWPSRGRGRRPRRSTGLGRRRADHVPRPGLDRGAGPRGGAEVPRDVLQLGGVLPGDGLPARADRASPPRAVRSGCSASRPRASRPTSPPPGRPGSPTTGTRWSELVTAQRVAVARALGAGPRPGHPAQPDPLGRADRLIMITHR